MKKPPPPFPNKWKRAVLPKLNLSEGGGGQTTMSSGQCPLWQARG